MAENSTGAKSEESSSSSSGEDRSQFEEKFPPDVPPEAGAAAPSFAVTVARQWVEQHQKATMLGAFAAGVFVGALFRE